MAVDPDWSDPCEVLAWLRPQYYRALSGGQAVRIAYAGRDTTYGQANIKELQALMSQLQSDCAAKQGLTTGRRRAFIAG